jgi:hypothetical protein
MLHALACLQLIKNRMHTPSQQTPNSAPLVRLRGGEAHPLALGSPQSYSTAALVSACPSLCSLLVRENESFDCMRGLDGSAPFGRTVAAGAGGGNAGPMEPPGSLYAATKLDQKNQCLLGFFERAECPNAMR